MATTVHIPNDLSGKTFAGQYSDPTMPLGQYSLRSFFSNGSIHFTIPALDSQIGPRINSLPFDVMENVTHTVPADACSPLTNAGDLNGKIALIKRGDCFFTQKIYAAQQAGAIAVIVYNNIPGYFRMAHDGSNTTVTIPSVSITQREGELFQTVLDRGDYIETIITDDGENSLRLAFNEHGHGSEVSGTLEFRLLSTADSRLWQDQFAYGKFTFSGTYDQSSGRLELSPGAWLVQPEGGGEVHVHTHMFGLAGTLKETGGITVFTGSELPPFMSSFHLHEEQSQCDRQIYAIARCEPSNPDGEAGSQCGATSCSIALNSRNFVVFNNLECAGGRPLRWYCEEDALAGTCEGLELHSRDVSGLCTDPGQELNSFWTYFPRDQNVSSLNIPGITFSTHCNITSPYPPTPCPDHFGWEMRGEYMWSGGVKALTEHNSNSYLKIELDIGPAGGTLRANIKTDGERGWDYLIVEANGTQIYRSAWYNIDQWSNLNYDLPPGHTTMLAYWRKDATVSRGVDGVFVRGLAITGSVGEACTSCPAGTCSGDKVATCRECEMGTYSSAGSGSCDACTNPLPDFARYGTGSASSSCEWTCMDGYQPSGDACVPKPQTCLLPATPVPPEVKGSTYISYTMLQQCLAMTPYNATAATQTMNTLRELASLYPNSRWQYTVNHKPDLNIFLNSYPTSPPSSDWEFHRQLSLKMRLYNDPDLLYTPPTFYQRIEMFLPLHMTTLVVPNENNRQGIFIDGVNSIAAFFGYLRPATDRNWDANDYYGWEVVEIDNTNAMAAISQFANNNNEVGVSPSPITRLNLALNSKLANATDEWLYWLGETTRHDNQGQYPVGAPQVNAGQWSCTFTQRNLGLCGPPSSPTVTLKLRQSSRAAPITVEVPWSIVYLGWSTVDVSPTSNSTMEDVFSHRNPVEPYNCSSSMLDLMSRPTARFWPDVPPANAEFSRNKMTTVPGGTLELLNAYETLSVFLFYPTGSAEVIGVLELRQLQYEEFAVHSAIADLVSKNVNRVMLDVRGNIGGSECHAEELAYLLANVSQVPFGRAAVQLLQSDLMRRTVTNQGAQPAEIRDSLSLAPQNFATYDEDEGLLQLDDDSFYRNGVNVVIGGTSVPFSRRVQRACRASDSILSFPSDTCSAPANGYWLQSFGESFQRLLRTTKDADWHPALSIISDGRCAGACATFVRILQSTGGVHTVGFGGLFGRRVPASIGGGALTSSDAQLQCAWRAGDMDNSRQLYLPWEGQTLRLPISAGFVGADVNNPSARPALFASNSAETRLSWVDDLDTLGRMRMWAGALIDAWPLAVPSFDLCESPNVGRNCRVNGGRGRQICMRTGDGSLKYGACRAVSCDPGYFRTTTEPPTCELAISNAKAIEAVLGQDSVQAANLRREIAYFLMNEAPDNGGLKSSGGGGGEWKSGAVGGLAFGMLLVGMILAMLLALAVHMRAPALLASLPGNIMGRLQDLRWENRGGGGSGRHIVTTPAPVNIPLDVATDHEIENPPPAAEGKSGFLANLQTRKSRGSLGADDTDERPMLSESADDDDKL